MISYIPCEDTPTFPVIHFLLVPAVQLGNHGYQNDEEYWLLDYSNNSNIIMLLW